MNEQQHSYPLDILRTELKLAMAEQLVQLMERFVSKQDLATFRGDFTTHLKDDEKHFREINEKLDTLLREKEQRAGARDERKSWVDRRRFVITTIVVLTCGFVGSVATLVWLAVG